MADVLLVLNAGSSSLKFSLYGWDTKGPSNRSLLCRGQIEGLPSQPRLVLHDGGDPELDPTAAGGADLPPLEPGHAAAIDYLLHFLQKLCQRQDWRLSAVGHRIVHGGSQFTGPIRIDEHVLKAMRALIPLAPLHQADGIAAIETVAVALPGLPQVACFDTAFHREMPPVAEAFALPWSLTDRGIKRYGFHGLSFQYIASRLPDLDPAAAGKSIVAHLGNGVSLCGMLAGKSQATTMGLTPLDGLPMGTRCGAVDPGVLLYLLQQPGWDVKTLTRLLYHESGLLGVSGVSGDMRVLLASEDPRAADAIRLFVYRLQREIGSLAAALQGLDAIIFTGGIGENSFEVRQRVCAGLGWMGVQLDPAANQAGRQRISGPDSQVSVWVLPTNEESIIVQQTLAVLNGC